MRIAVPREIRSGERRVALVPESVKKLTKAGITVTVERGAGEGSFLTDSLYREAGAELEGDVAALFGVPTSSSRSRPRSTSSSRSTRPTSCARAPCCWQRWSRRATRTSWRSWRRAEVTAFAMDLIPRITRAQTMDTLSSMATIAGYKAVLLAANRLPRYFPMLMTAAGTVVPAKVFVIGAGVAGLQAIATARRLGAVVAATDVRPAVKEQVESLGAKFVGVVAEEAQDARATPRSCRPDFYRKQRS